MWCNRLIGLGGLLGFFIGSPAFAGTMGLLHAGSGAPGGVAPTFMVTPLLVASGSTANNPSTTAINYMPLINGSAVSVYSGTQSNRQQAIATAGTIGNLQVAASTTIAAGFYEVSLFNSTTKTAVTCAFGQGQTAVQTCSSAATANVAVGDILSFGVCPSNGTGGCTAGSVPTAMTTPIQVSVTFSSTTGQEGPIFFGVGGANMGTAAKNYMGLGANVNWNTTENLVSSVIAAPGTLDNLNIKLNGSPTAGQYVFTLFKNGTATALTCTVTTAATTCSTTSGTNAVSVVQGDVISLEEDPTTGSAPTARLMGASLRWRPTTAGQGLVFSTPGTVPTTNATRYLPVSGVLTNATVEANEENISPGGGMTIKNLTVAQCPGPGAGVTRSVTVRSGGSDQSPTATVAAGTTACPTYSTATNTNTYSPAAGTLFHYSTTVSAANTALTQFKVGAVVTVP